jgi:phospholipase/carboxylesterase
MHRSARPGDARLHARPVGPSQPALAPGVHELTGLTGALASLGKPRPAPGALLFVPSTPLPATPLLVFFHGAGGNAATSLPLLQPTAERHGCLVLLPSSTGRSWDLIVEGWGPDVDRTEAALALVFDRFAVSRSAFGGFSDGASYALSIGLANGELAGTVLAFSPGFAMPPDRVGRPRVWISHGIQDAVLPIDRCARPIARNLTQAGYDIDYQEFPGPHTVPPDHVERAVRWWLTGPTRRGSTPAHR